MKKTVTVIGAGAFGLALADYLARTDHDVRCWDRDSSVLERLRTTRTVDRPKGLVAHPSITYIDDIVSAVKGAGVILSAVPSFAMVDICKALSPLDWEAPGAIFVNCSKGIEPGTNRLPCQIFEQEIGLRDDLRYSVLAGPSHAEEITRDVPTAVVAAAPRVEDAEQVQRVFGSHSFRVYVQPDYKAAELGGALKNVMAIAAGIADGKGYGDNTKAALITRGVAEIARMAVAMNASAETVAGLSGLGDLIVTSMSRHSRNRQFGELLSSGMKPEAALKAVGAVVEGYRTAKSAYELSRSLELEMPLIESIYAILYQDIGIDEGINRLLDRNMSTERLS